MVQLKTSKVDLSAVINSVTQPSPATVSVVLKLCHSYLYEAPSTCLLYSLL